MTRLARATAPLALVVGGLGIVTPVHADVDADDNAYVVWVNDAQERGSAQQSRAPENPVVQTSRTPACVPAAGGCQPSDCGDGGTLYWLHIQREDGDRSRELDCVGEAVAEAAPEVTSTLVLEAFRRIPLPKSSVSIQPPGGRTLVNFKTIFSADAAPFTETVTLLGQAVELEITPTQWTWSFGDGTTLTTDTGGQPWAEGVEVSDENYVIHRYAQTAGAAPVSVAVTWSARWRTTTRDWQPVGETVTTEGPVSNLEVAEAVPVLVGD